MGERKSEKEVKMMESDFRRGRMRKRLNRRR